MIDQPCPIAASVAQRVTERAQVGLDKYGTNLTRTDLTHGQWLQHLQDELLDGANYVERLKAIATDQAIALEKAEEALKECKEFLTGNAAVSPLGPVAMVRVELIDSALTLITKAKEQPCKSAT